jgi:hypothetical protein
MESSILILHHHCNHASQQCIMFMVIHNGHCTLSWSILSLFLDCINRHVLQSTLSSHSNNELWAGMFRTSFINLLCYLHLLSLSFVMNVTDIYRPYVVILALWELDHLFHSYLVILISSCSRHQPSLVWLLFVTFDGGFASLPLRVFRPNLGTRFFLGGRAVTVHVFVN